MEDKPVIREPLLSGNDLHEAHFQGSHFDVETLRFEADGADETLQNLASSMDKWSSLRTSKMPQMNELENGSSSGEDDDGDLDGFKASTSSMTASLTLRRLGKYFLRKTSKSNKRQKYCSIPCFTWMRVPILRQRWVKCDGNVYLNSSLHEERRPRWMDLFLIWY